MDENTLGFGSSEAGKKGGEARAKALSGEEKAAIARRAANARWGVDDPRHTLCAGSLRLDGGIVIACAVLDDKKTRVLSQRGFAETIGAAKPSGRNRRGDGELPAFLSAANLKAFITNDLVATAKPIEYYPEHGGRTALGIRAEAIVPLLRVWVNADDAGVLRHNQTHLAARARVLLNALAGVGVVALVDEATGFQDQRAKDALVRVLEAFVAKELQEWVGTFSLDFFRELCALRKVPFRGDMKYPKYFGHLINNIIYSRLAPGVLEVLQEKNPITETGNRAAKHHQLLTRHIGHPKLRELLGSSTTLMRMANIQQLGWDEFVALMDQFHPQYRDAPLFQEQIDSDGKL